MNPPMNTTTTTSAPTTAARKAKKTKPKTFKQGYDILKANAQSLQHQQEPDIDNLMTLVEESIAAYQVCQARLTAVQQALDSAFANDGYGTVADIPQQDPEDHQ